MTEAKWKKSYLRLHPEAAIKILEQPFIYHIGKDELYEIDDRAKNFFIRCKGTSIGEELTDDSQFVQYCLEEEILEVLEYPEPINIPVAQSLNPSLRYLELQLLHRCNLKCLHCYLGHSQTDKEMPLDDAIKITKEFAEFGGLRLIISGGEPLLYKNLPQYFEQISDLKVRRVLFTNGTLINTKNIKNLKVDEIQFSLDGWNNGHDKLRGIGSFKKTMQGIYTAKEAGIAISISTMIHRYNLDEFDLMGDFVEEIGAIDWGIDVLAVTGSLINHQNLAVPYKTAVNFLKYAFGGGYHGSSEGYACGRHLITVMPDGCAVKCGFYSNKPLGNAARSLKNCWLNIKHIPLVELECKDCSAIEECKGGCRFRASHPLGPDPVMCYAYGKAKE